MRLNNGDGTFGADRLLKGVLLRDLITGDFNGDGNQDVAGATTGSLTPAIRILLGDGNGNLSVGDTIQSTFATSLVFLTGDFNGDGRLDLGTSNVDQAMMLFFGNSDGTFQAGAALPINAEVQSAQARDLDGDGILDLILGAPGDELAVLFGNGDGTFQDPLRFAAFRASDNLTGVAIGDTNGDGRPDIVAGSVILLQEP